jgi:hypothetical protein
LTALRAEGCGIALRAMSILPPVGGRKTVQPGFARWKCNRVEIIHPSHTTVRTVRYTAVRFFGQEYIPACHFFRFLKIILSTPFRIFASSAIFRQEVSPLTAFCFNV